MNKGILSNSLTKSYTMFNQFYLFLDVCNGLEHHTHLSDQKTLFEQDCDERNDRFYKVSLEMTHFLRLGKVPYMDTQSVYTMFVDNLFTPFCSTLTTLTYNIMFSYKIKYFIIFTSSK
jgi:hypothetical protein